MIRKENKKRRIEDIVEPRETVIASESNFHGTISGSDSVRIAGRLEGKVESGQLVIIEAGGMVNGTIKGLYVIISGELNGDIVSSERVELRVNGRMRGNIHTSKIAMADGSYFEGEIRMPGKKDKPTVFVEKRGKKMEDASG